MKISFGILFFCFSWLSASSQANDDSKKLDMFFNRLRAEYVDSLSSPELVEVAIRAVLADLDPHSVYMNPKQYKAATEPLEGKYSGIGIRFQVIDDTITIVDVFPDGPAAKADMRIGDQFVTMNGDTVLGARFSRDQIIEKLKGSAGTSYSFLLRRNLLSEVQWKTIDLKTDEIVVSSIDASFMIEKETGYIHLEKFGGNSVEDFKLRLEELNKLGMKNLILDLRGNTGGYLNAAVKIADEFLANRQLIVYTEGIHQDRKETYATSGGKFTKGKLVVLIDQHTASASEILAGALQDLDRALIVGRRSFGKGLVQRTYEFEDGSAMRLTTSRYYTPSGRSIQKPYDESVEAYRMEVKSRLERGELQSDKNIDLDTSRTYYTASNRRVYGGGGIVPDLFVAQPIESWTDVQKEFIDKALVFGFALQWTRLHSEAMRSKYSSVQKFFESFRIESIDQELEQYARLRMDRSEEEFLDMTALHPQIKEQLAHFIFGFEGMKYIQIKADPMIAKAVDAIRTDQFRELGIN